MEENNSMAKTNIKKWIFLAVLIVLLIFFGFWSINRYWHPLPPTAAEFGDSFGAANALFSALAFAFLIVTVLMQRKELEFQRQELRDTRKEFITQNKTLKTQLFENTFFNMLSLHNQIVNDMDFQIHESAHRGIRGQTLTGRDVFRNRFKALNKAVKNNIKGSIVEYNKIFDERRSDFGHYFRNLYRIFKLIDDQYFYSYSELNLNRTDKEDSQKFKMQNEHVRYKYSSIMRAQLSDYELLLIFYNGLSEKGKKFKPLIEKYSLLDNMDKKEIIDKNLLEKYFTKAFDSKLR